MEAEIERLQHECQQHEIRAAEEAESRAQEAEEAERSAQEAKQTCQMLESRINSLEGKFIVLIFVNCATL